MFKLKNIIIFFSLAFLLNNLIVFANEASPISFLKTKYNLKYSNCTVESNICLNEYYKAKEKGLEWTELLTVLYFKNENDPVGYASDVAKLSKYSRIMHNENLSGALVEFIIPYSYKNLRGFEHNLLRIEKNPQGKGCVALQYAKKWPLNNDKEQELFKENLNKHSDKIVKEMINVNIPSPVFKQLQKW